MFGSVKEAVATKRLVLGFDGGCSTCSAVAARVKEAVGDRLEIASLRDTQVTEWRKQALGEDAPWAPTLFEIEGQKVRAWTGGRMGLRLSRSLGPIKTWRVAQALAGTGGRAVPEAAGSALRPTRAQVLKGGLSGAAVGASMLFGTGGFASAAGAAEAAPASTGNLAQRRKAKAIVNASDEFKGLARKQGRQDSSFDFDRAITHVRDGFAVVTVPALDKRRSVIGTFYADLSREKVTSHRSLEIAPVSGGKEARVTIGETGQRAYKITLGRDQVTTEDGRKIDSNKFMKEAAEGSDFITTQADECPEALGYLCSLGGTSACYFSCIALGLTTIFLGLGCALVCTIIVYRGCDVAFYYACEGGV